MSREKDGERIIGEDRGARLNFLGRSQPPKRNYYLH